MILATAQSDREMGAFQIFLRFSNDVLLTGAVYVLLIGATIILRYFAEMLKQSALHYAVLEFLEHAIFFCGSVIVLLVLIYVTAVTAADLVL